MYQFPNLEDFVSVCAAFSSPVRSAIFAYIASGEDPVSLTDIAEAMMMNPGNAKRQVDTLRTAGLIEVKSRRTRGKLYGLSKRWSFSDGVLTLTAHPFALGFALGEISDALKGAERIAEIHNADRGSERDSEITEDAD